MISHDSIEGALVIIFVISIVLFYIEVKEYYLGEEEMRRTNDMYIFHISILSNKGIICGIIAAVSIITLLLLYLESKGILFSIGG